MLPPDCHVHTEWSWDAPSGSMLQTCQRASELGLATVVFTDHADFAPWELTAGQVEQVPAHLRPHLRPPATLVPPPLDVAGYRACLDRCRGRFPALRILAGVELSEPHLFPAESAELLGSGVFDHVVAGVHSLAEAGRFVHAPWLFASLAPADVMRRYLASVERMIAEFERFTILAHVDYTVRNWPAGVPRYEPADFEMDFRRVLGALAKRGGALEVNARVPLDPDIVRWWREEGGVHLALGSDAHDPASLAGGLRDLAAMVAWQGFVACEDGSGLWACD